MKPRKKQNAASSASDHTPAGAPRKKIKCPVCASVVEVPKASNMPEFIGYAMESYQKRFNAELVFGVKEANLIYHLLRKIELNALKIYWHWFINYTGKDWYISNATKDISGFGVNINRISQLCKIRSKDVNSPSPPAGEGRAGPSPEPENEEQEVLLDAKSSMFEYFNSIIEPESPDYDRWAEKLDNVETLAELESWDNEFQQWRRKNE